MELKLLQTLHLLTQAKATSLTLVGELGVLGPQNVAIDRPSWFTPIGTLSFSLSLAVNAILSGLLVFKIAKTALALGDSRGRGMTDMRPIISMLVESGLIFFMAQLVWVVCFTVESVGFYLVGGPITMIYVRDYFQLPPPSFDVFQRELYRQLLWCGSQ